MMIETEVIFQSESESLESFSLNDELIENSGKVTIYRIIDETTSK
jgi:hypothetical protein